MEALNDTTEQFSYEVPLFVSYLKMFIQLIAPVAIGLASFLVLRVIAFTKELHTKYYFILANLLVTDLVGIILENTATFIATGIYVLGIEAKVNCILMKSFDAPASVGQLLFFALGIDRFIAIAYPYQHRSLMSMKRVCSMIIAIWAISIGVNGILISATKFQYVHQLGRCYPLTGFPSPYMIKAFVNISATVGMIAINVYLYKEITASNKRHNDNLRLDGQQGNARKRDGMRKRLREHIKPAMSLLILGGIDAAFNLLQPFIYVPMQIILGNNSVARLYLAEFVGRPIQWCQLMSHPLVYGIYMTKIRQRIFDFELYYMIFGRRSKVIVLNKNWRRQ